MHIRFTTLITALVLALGAGAAHASFFEGKDALICSVHQLFECDPPNGCIAVGPGEISGFAHFDVDFRKKVITRTGEDSPQKSAIKNVSTAVDGKLIIQGVEDGEEDARDGAGWSVSIMDPEGTMVMAIAGDGFGVVGLGACAPKP